MQPEDEPRRLAFDSQAPRFFVNFSSSRINASTIAFLRGISKLAIRKQASQSTINHGAFVFFFLHHTMFFSRCVLQLLYREDIEELRGIVLVAKILVPPRRNLDCEKWSAQSRLSDTRT